MTLFEKINEGIKEAMKNREQLRLSTLRMLKSKILTVDARGNLSDAEVLKLFKTYLGNLQEALAQAQSANRKEMADQLMGEIAIVQEFLPKPLSEEEIRQIVQQAIQESNAKTKKDLGIVMKAIMKINSDIDGKQAKEVASQMLCN